MSTGKRFRLSLKKALKQNWEAAKKEWVKIIIL